VAPGVLANDDRGYRYLKYVYKEGNGWPMPTAHSRGHPRASSDILGSPIRTGRWRSWTCSRHDLIGTWTYTNNDPKLMLYIETMRPPPGAPSSARSKRDAAELPRQPGAARGHGESSSSQWFASNPQHAGWVLMGPDRCKEVSWIICRAHRSSSLLLQQRLQSAELQQARGPVPRAARHERRDQGAVRHGLRALRPDADAPGRAKRRIAVVSSQASRLYGKAPRTRGYPNEQIYGSTRSWPWRTSTATCSLTSRSKPARSRTTTAGAAPLRGWSPRRCATDPRFCEARRPGARDPYLGLDVPGAIKFDFDFTYRGKVNADAIASGTMFAAWDDQLNPKTAALAEAKGVTAEDDQKIMESYVRRLQKDLAGKLEPAVSVDTPEAAGERARKQRREVSGARQRPPHLRRAHRQVQGDHGETAAADGHGHPAQLDRAGLCLRPAGAQGTAVRDG